MTDDELLSALKPAQAAAATGPAGGATAGPSDEDLLTSLAPAPKPPRTWGQAIGDTVRDVGAGAVRGAGSIGATILTPIDAAARAAGIENDIIGRRDRREAMTGALGELGADTDSIAFKGGKLAGEIAGTAGLPIAVARPLMAVAPNLARAVAAGGLGREAASLGLATRTAGGAVSGALQAAAVNPDDAAAGAGVGAALPGVGRVLGAAGRALSGPVLPSAIREAAQAGHAAGYVIPPTQVAPTFSNRLLEGVSGKISTAQNASARNQEVTNRLAREAIGAPDLTPESLQAVRDVANQAYDRLGAMGTLGADIPFRRTLSKIGAASEKMKADFPQLADGADALVKSFQDLKSFDARSALEAMKRLRAGARANAKAFDDPEKLALSRVQRSISDALEDLTERTLSRTKQTGLLADFRGARTTLAKLHDIEAALNPVTGNVDAAKLARSVKAGRPLTGELRQAGAFASAFPKAVQTVERMGSLPQTSPLDWAAAGITAAATGGSPLSAAALAARPAARAAALSPLLQRRALAKAMRRAGPSPSAIRLAQIARVAPVALTNAGE